MVLMVLVYVMLVDVMLTDAHIETQTEAVSDALLCHRLSLAHLGLGCLLICHRLGIAAAGGHREHAEQTQLRARQEIRLTITKDLGNERVRARPFFGELSHIRNVLC